MSAIQQVNVAQANKPQALARAPQGAPNQAAPAAFSPDQSSFSRRAVSAGVDLLSDSRSLFVKKATASASTYKGTLDSLVTEALNTRAAIDGAREADRQGGAAVEEARGLLGQAQQAEQAEAQRIGGPLRAAKELLDRVTREQAALVGAAEGKLKEAQGALRHAQFPGLKEAEALDKRAEQQAQRLQSGQERLQRAINTVDRAEERLANVRNRFNNECSSSVESSLRSELRSLNSQLNWNTVERIGRDLSDRPAADDFWGNVADGLDEQRVRNKRDSLKAKIATIEEKLADLPERARDYQAQMRDLENDISEGSQEVARIRREDLPPLQEALAETRARAQEKRERKAADNDPGVVAAQRGLQEAEQALAGAKAKQAEALDGPTKSARAEQGKFDEAMKAPRQKVEEAAAELRKREEARNADRSLDQAQGKLEKLQDRFEALSKAPGGLKRFWWWITGQLNVKKTLAEVKNRGAF